MSAPDFLLRLEQITKRFPGIVANDKVTLRVARGTFHAVIGENGAGKSTLLNILYGRYKADGGQVWIAGEEVTHALHSPADAIARGIGLVSQHYALIPALTVLENVMLGAEHARAGGLLQPRQARERMDTLARPLGLTDVDWNQRAERLSVAAQQKVEILKALYRGAQVLLLDEPTATLAPQEIEALFDVLQNLRAQGATIVFVTHKLREVMAHSDRVTVLRTGRNAGDFVTSQTTPDELLHCMIGQRTVSHARVTTGPEPTSAAYEGEEHPLLTSPFVRGRNQVAPPDEGENGASTPSPYEGKGNALTPSPYEGEGRGGVLLLRAANASVRNARKALAVDSVSLDVRAGEIVGVAGVDGSGQRELAEALVGLRRLETGTLHLNGSDLTRQSVHARQQAGLAYIPEDRHKSAMILDFSIAENYLLGHERDSTWGGGLLLRPGSFLSRAAHMIERFDVRGASRNGAAPARTLSGGNQQKVVIARALDSNPSLLIACQPTRGLDVEATRFVYAALREARAKGLGVLLFSLDLDEIRELSDRVAVLFNGRLAGVLSREEATPDALGALMTGAKRGAEA